MMLDAMSGTLPASSPVEPKRRQLASGELSVGIEQDG